MHCLFKDLVGDCLTLRGSTVVKEELEDRVAARECGSHDVLKLNLELIAGIERLEGVLPVVNVQESFLMWVKFREELLDQRLC